MRPAYCPRSARRARPPLRSRGLLFLFVGFLLLPSGLLPIGALSAQTVTFVQKGRALGVYEDGIAWTRGDGFLEGTGDDALLLADHDLGDGDFEVRAVLSFEKVGHTRVSMKLGDGWIAFDHENQTIVSHKLASGADQTHGQNQKFFRAGKPFELKLSRKGPRLQLWIDGREVFDLSVPRRSIGPFGFRPNETTIRLHRFMAKGSVLDVGRRVRIDPAEFEALERDERIQHAIEAGCDYLISHIRQQREAYTTSHQANRAGAVALETYALLVAGIPVDSKEIEENFAYMKRELMNRGRTYDLACYLFALDAAIAQLEYDVILTKPDLRDTENVGKTFRRRMKDALEVLLNGQTAGGAWRYDTSSTDFDHSCTQFAALGLGVAARRGLRIPDSTWVRLAEHLLDHQQPSGPETARRAELAPGGRAEFSWSEAERGREEKRKGRGKRGDDERGGTSVGEKTAAPDPFVGDETVPIHVRGWEYAKAATDGATWNMTCSGVSSLMLLYAHGGHALRPELRIVVSESIRDGIGYMLDNWQPHSTLYGLYSLEKVADIGGIERFDGQDWYEDSSQWLLDSQQKDGSWKSGGTGEVDRVSTAFALLILRRATTLLTRNPAERIIATGSGELSREREENRSWVYLPRLDRAISLPGLLRTLRMRPSRHLLVLLEEVCAQYPEEYAPELIPTLVETRGRLQGKGPAASLDRCLETVGGREFEGTDSALAWHERWSAVRALADAEQDPVAQLLEAYREAGDDPRLRAAILRVLIQHPNRTALPTILPDLESRELTLRTLVYRAITASHIEPPPRFQPDAPAAVREGQAEKVRAWVEARQSR